jgi:two-component system response regulator TctD
MRLLIVEDNRQLSDWLARLLRKENYAVDCLNNGEDALHALSGDPYDLAIVDLGLPEMDGIALIRAIRDRANPVPILILTANDALDSRVGGLNAGADDYLVKPFEMAELEARLRALLRRSAAVPRAQITFGPLVLDQNTHLFSLQGAPLSLSPREYGVLETLVRKAGLTVSKSLLMESIYGFDDIVDSSAIEIYVHRIRKKLERSPVNIVTLRGLGYLLRIDNDS